MQKEVKESEGHVFKGEEKRSGSDPQVCTGNNDHVHMHIIFTVSTRFVNEFNPFLPSHCTKCVII